MSAGSKAAEDRARRLALRKGLRLVKLRGYAANYYGKPYVIEEADTGRCVYGDYNGVRGLSLDDAIHILSTS